MRSAGRRGGLAPRDAYRGYQIGYQGVAEVVSLLHHHAVPRTVDTGSIVATQSNMNQPAIHKLLFPPAIGG